MGKNMEEYKKFLDEINGKNINFLIGSGASTGIIPNLWLKGIEKSFEDLLVDEDLEKYRNELYFIWFNYWVAKTRILNKPTIPREEDVYKNYIDFVNNLIILLNNEGFDRPKKVNIFTTNYDTLFELAFDHHSKRGAITFFNDGSRGFLQKYISSENFYINASHTGVSESFSRNIPIINLLKIHGSVTWRKDDESDNIEVSLNNNNFNKLKVEADKYIENAQVVNIIENLDKDSYNFVDLKNDLENIFNDDSIELTEFQNSYEKLNIVSPTKEKFKETVFQQHYYQMLRILSFELERKDSVLVVFGFSFADEHIREIVKRSITNPYLKVYIICYSQKGEKDIKEYLKGLNNITYWPNFNDNSRLKGDFKFLNNLMKGWK